MTDRAPRRALPPDDSYVPPHEDESEQTVVLRRLALPDDMGYSPAPTRSQPSRGVPPVAQPDLPDWYGAVINGGSALSAQTPESEAYDPPYDTQPRYGDAQYADTRYADTRYGEPQYGETQYGETQYESPYADTRYAEAQYGNAQYGEAQYGEAQYGETQYGETQYEGPYGDVRYGEARYGDAPYGQPAAPYGQPAAQYGQPEAQYGQPEAQYGQPAAQYGQPEAQYGEIQYDYAEPQYGDDQYEDEAAYDDETQYDDTQYEAEYDDAPVDEIEGEQPLVIPDGEAAEFYPSRHASPASHRRDHPTTPKHRSAASAEHPHKRSAKPAIIVIGVVLVIVALVGVVVWAITNGPLQRPGQQVTGGPAPDPMLAAPDLGPLGLGSEWNLTPTQPDRADFACVGAAIADDPAPRLVTRGLTSATTATDTVLQLSATYEDAAAATAAYNRAFTLSGTCPDNAAQVTGAFAVSGLSDAASAVTLMVWGPTPDTHTTLIARSGRTLTFVDVTTTGKAVMASSVASASTSAMTRLCADGQSACPSTVTVTPSVPAPGDPPGWLLPADLPRITPDAGIWGAIDLDSVKSLGSQCDGVVLGGIPRTTATSQRTLLLNEDPKQSLGFGVDEVGYTFATVKDATTLAKSLTTNISGCPTTVPTAKVSPGKAVKGAAGGVDITASPFTITHTVNGAVTAIFRVSVIQTGPKVGYLLASVSSDFDFTDTEWNDITLRAGERMTQSLTSSATSTPPAANSASPSSTP